MRRTPDAIRAIRESDAASAAFDSSMPLGPWPSFDAAEEELAPWCRDTTLCGGGWGVSRRDLRLPNTRRGTQRVLACHMRSKQCSWRLTLEESTAGWVVRSLNAVHTNHDLTQSLAESNSYAGMREIPSQFHDLMRMVAAAGLAPAVVFKVLQAAAEKAKIAVTWNYNDVYTFVSATAAEKAFDATGLLELLEERLKLHGLPYYYSTDADGRLSRVFAVLAGALEGYAKCFSLDADGEVQVNEAAVQYDVTVRLNRAFGLLTHRLHSIARIFSAARDGTHPSAQRLDHGHLAPTACQRVPTPRAATLWCNSHHSSACAAPRPRWSRERGSTGCVAYSSWKLRGYFR
jgi:hypothetical protein